MIKREKSLPELSDNIKPFNIHEIKKNTERKWRQKEFKKYLKR